jgi:hypothetical protein
MWSVLLLVDPSVACSVLEVPPTLAPLPPPGRLGFPVDGVARVLFTDHDPESLAQRLRLVGPGGEEVPIDRVGWAWRIDLVPREPLAPSAAYAVQRLFPYSDGRLADERRTTPDQWLWAPITTFVTEGPGGSHVPRPPAVIPPPQVVRTMARTRDDCGAGTRVGVEIAAVPADGVDVVAELEEARLGVLDTVLAHDHRPSLTSYVPHRDEYRLRVVLRTPDAARAGPWMQVTTEGGRSLRHSAPPQRVALPGPSSTWPEAPQVAGHPACASLTPAGARSAEGTDAADPWPADATVTTADDGSRWGSWYEPPPWVLRGWDPPGDGDGDEDEQEGKLWLLSADAPDANLPAVLRTAADAVEVLDAARDGDRLAFVWASRRAGRWSTDVAIVDLQTGRLAWSTTDAGGSLDAGAAGIVSHGGRWHIAWSDGRQEQGGTWLSSMPLAGGGWSPRVRLADDRAIRLDLAASPVGVAAVIDSGAVQLVRPGHAPVLLDPTSTGPSSRSLHLVPAAGGWVASWTVAGTAWAVPISASGSPGVLQTVSPWRGGDPVRWTCSAAPGVGPPVLLPRASSRWSPE